MEPTVKGSESALLSSGEPSFSAAKRAKREGPVLLATDSRGSSDASLVVANLVAQRLGVALEVVSVLDPMPVYAGGADIVSYPISFELERMAAHESHVRRRLATALGHENWRLTTRTGSVVREIADVARQLQPSMIVVGAAPHHRFGQLVSGARAAQLLRAVDVPVLSITPRAALPKQAVVAVDFSPASVRACSATLSILEPSGTITLLHVVPDMEFGRPLTLEDLQRRERTAGETFTRLRDELAGHISPSTTVEMRTVSGRVDDAVLQCAQEVGADLIAVGTHGPGFVERLFVGSVATSILHASPCSVLASPSPNAAESLRIRLRTTGTVWSDKPSEWGPFLDSFSARNAGRAATLEIDDQDLGAQMQARGYRFSGATYDPHDRCVEVMLGGALGDTHHLTRIIPDVDFIAVQSGADGRDSALAMCHGRGQSLLLFGA